MLLQRLEALRLRFRYEGVSGMVTYLADMCRPGEHQVFYAAGAPPPPPAAPPFVTVVAGIDELRRVRHPGLPEAYYRDEIKAVRKCFVALSNGELAGVLWAFDEVYPSHFIELRANEVELGHGHVLPKFRGLGIFRALIASSFAELHAAGYSGFYAVIDDRNTASRKAFETCGFRCVGRIPRPWSDLFGAKFRLHPGWDAIPLRPTLPERLDGRVASPGGGPQPLGETPVPASNSASASAVALAEPHPASSFQLAQVDLAASDGEFCFRWRRFLERAEWGHYQQSCEAARLRSHMGWKGRFIFAESAGTIVAGALLLTKRLLGGSLGFAMVPSGPIWLPGYEYLLGEILRSVEASCRHTATVFCRINPRCPVDRFPELVRLLPPNHRQSPQTWTYWNMPRLNMRIDLSIGIERIIQGMHLSLRRSYRNSIKHGVSVRAGGREDIPAFARLMKRMGDRKEMPVRDESHFHDFLDTHPADSTLLLLAEAEGAAIGATLTVDCGQSAHYLYGAFDYEKRALYPNVALQVEMMRWAIQQGCTSYDLGGACVNWPPTEDQKGYGVFLFKQRLGAQLETDAPYCDLIYRPRLYGLFLRVENVGLPLVMERGKGRMIVARERLEMEKSAQPSRPR